MLNGAPFDCFLKEVIHAMNYQVITSSNFPDVRSYFPSDVEIKIPVDLKWQICYYINNMSNGIEGGPGIPQERLGDFPPQRPDLNEVAARQHEATLRGTELIRDPDVSPDVARELLVHELLFPAEKGRLEMSRWEVNPTLRELLRRAGERGGYKRLAEILVEQNDKLAKIAAELEDLRQKGGEEQKLKEKEKQLEYLKRTKNRTGRIVEARERSSLVGDESREWFRLYKEVDAAVAWHEIYLQRVKAQPEVDTYAKSLFTSNFFIAFTETSSLVYLLEQRDYGPAIERALRAYVDIHLKGELGGRKVDKNLRILQNDQAASTEKQREEVYEAVREVADEDPFVAERAEILARHLCELSLLSVWLSVPRDSKGRIIYKDDKGNVQKYGCRRLEGASPNDLDKLVLFRLKYWSELNKSYSSVAGGMARYIPESLTPTFFHFMSFKEEGVEKSVFDEWYFKRGSLPKLIAKVQEGDFSFWAYLMFRQNNTREHLLNFSRGGREDCIEELKSIPKLRSMKKDFALAFISDPLLREITKINMIGCRIIAYSGGANTEIITTQDEVASQKERIRLSCIKSGFLGETGWGLVNEVLAQRKALIPEEVLRNSSKVFSLLGEAESQKLQVAFPDLRQEIQKITEGDQILNGVSVRLNEAKVKEEKIDPPKLKAIIDEEGKKARAV